MDFSAEACFTRIVDKVPYIEYQESWRDIFGGFDGAITASIPELKKPGNVVSSNNKFGCKMLLIHTRFGNVIIDSEISIDGGESFTYKVYYPSILHEMLPIGINRTVTKELMWWLTGESKLHHKNIGQVMEDFFARLKYT